MCEERFTMDMSNTTQYCRNCKREIAGPNFIIHEAHCLRTIVLCEVCKEPVSKDMLQEHMETEHQEVVCKCGMKMEKKYFEKHQIEECMLQNVPCEFCKMGIQLRNLPEHQNYCGSRTDLCPLCQKRITYWEMEHHCETCTGPSITPQPRGRPGNITDSGDSISTDSPFSTGESITRTLTHFFGPTMLDAFSQIAQSQNTNQAHTTTSGIWPENTGRPGNITDTGDSTSADSPVSTGESISRTLTHLFGPTMLDAFSQIAQSQNTNQAHMTASGTCPENTGIPGNITDAGDSISTDSPVRTGESITRTLTHLFGPTMLETFNQIAQPQNTNRAHMTASSTWPENSGPRATTADVNDWQALYTSRMVQTLTRAVLDSCDLAQSVAPVDSDQMHRWFPDPQPEERDDAVVPCQFCEALIPFQDIITHQNACAQATTPSTTESLDPTDSE